MADDDTRGDAPTITIKKYANRRLYNTETSSYITLDHLAQLVREGREFRVVDAKTDEDLTHAILTQIIMEAEGRGASMLPPSFLKQLIALYGQQLGAVMPSYLEASMEAFQRHQSQLSEAMTSAMATGPFGELAKQNAAIFQAAARSFAPTPPPAAPARREVNDELDALRAQIADLQAKVEKLAS